MIKLGEEVESLKAQQKEIQRIANLKEGQALQAATVYSVTDVQGCQKNYADLLTLQAWCPVYISEEKVCLNVYMCIVFIYRTCILQECVYYY